MNEQDIINRLTRIEKALEDIAARLPTAQVYQAQPLQRPHNWPWGYPVTRIVECGAAGSTADSVSSMGANGGAK